MPQSQHQDKRTQGWLGIHRGHKARPLEWLAEKFIFFVSLSTILVVFLIFVFVAREAMPIFLGEENSALIKPVIPVAEMDKLKPEELRVYLDLSEKKFAELDKETLQALMEVKVESQNEIPERLLKDPDAKLNTTE